MKPMLKGSHKPSLDPITGNDRFCPRIRVCDSGSVFYFLYLASPLRNTATNVIITRNSSVPGDKSNYIMLEESSFPSFSSFFSFLSFPIFFIYFILYLFPQKIAAYSILFYLNCVAESSFPTLQLMQSRQLIPDIKCMVSDVSKIGLKLTKNGLTYTCLQLLSYGVLVCNGLVESSFPNEVVFLYTTTFNIIYAKASFDLFCNCLCSHSMKIPRSCCNGR